MSDDTPAIDRSPIRRVDWDQTFDGSGEPALEALSRFDIAAIIEAAHLLAASMRTMAERIRELEAHAEAFATSNDELEANNRQLTVELREVLQERKSLAASLAAESERLRQLERYAALGEARATALNRDLSAAHVGLTRIVDAVGSRLAADASVGAEDPATRMRSG